MITKIFNTTTVADGSTERLTVHTKIGEFEVSGKRIACHVRPRDNDEYDAEFGKALAKKKFDILSTVKRIDRFDKSYGSNGDQILHTHSGIVEFFRYVDYQPQVMFDQRGFCLLFLFC